MNTPPLEDPHNEASPIRTFSDIARRLRDSRSPPDRLRPLPNVKKSGNDLLHHVPRHIREWIVASAVSVSQPGMVPPHEVQDRGVEVGNDMRSEVFGATGPGWGEVGEGGGLD